MLRSQELSRKCVEQVMFGYRSERSLMLSVRMERIERNPHMLTAFFDDKRPTTVQPPQHSKQMLRRAAFTNESVRRISCFQCDDRILSSTAVIYKFFIHHSNRVSSSLSFNSLLRSWQAGLSVNLCKWCHAAFGRGEHLAQAPLRAGGAAPPSCACACACASAILSASSTAVLTTCCSSGERVAVS